MNRRELFAGAGAAALSAAVPPAARYGGGAGGGKTARSVRAFEGLQPRFHTDALTGTTSVWLVSWGADKATRA